MISSHEDSLPAARKTRKDQKQQSRWCTVVKSFTSLVRLLAGSVEVKRLNVVNITGLIILARNYLDVYPYDKWTGKEIPDFREGEEFEPTSCEIKEGQTTSPTLLTEADLVTLMDKNGIGKLLWCDR